MEKARKRNVFFVSSAAFFLPAFSLPKPFAFSGRRSRRFSVGAAREGNNEEEEEE
jgi:hypothetical protein